LSLGKQGMNTELWRGSFFGNLEDREGCWGITLRWIIGRQKTEGGWRWLRTEPNAGLGTIGFERLELLLITNTITGDLWPGICLCFLSDSSRFAQSLLVFDERWLWSSGVRQIIFMWLQTYRLHQGPNKLLTSYESTRCHNLEGHNRNFRRSANLKYHTSGKSYVTPCTLQQLLHNSKRRNHWTKNNQITKYLGS
jgi:hypothetical protein